MRGIHGKVFQLVLLHKLLLPSFTFPFNENLDLFVKSLVIILDAANHH